MQLVDLHQQVQIQEEVAETHHPILGFAKL
jgi:hypothetical protein